MESQVTDWGRATMASLTGAMGLFFSSVPKTIGFVVILLIGWLVASLIARALATILRGIRFNQLADRSGLTGFVQNMGSDADSAGMLAGIIKWFVRLVALVVAFDALGLPAVSDVLRQLLLWLPNLVVALVVLVIGGIAANALARIVRASVAESELGDPDFLSKVATVAVWAFTIVVAVNQIGIATALVNTLFMATVGAVALGFGLAFGLGGRDTAADIVHRWYHKAQEKQARFEHAANVAGSLTKADGGQVAHRGSSTMPM